MALLGHIKLIGFLNAQKIFDSAPCINQLL